MKRAIGTRRFTVSVLTWSQIIIQLVENFLLKFEIVLIKPSSTSVAYFIFLALVCSAETYPEVLILAMRARGTFLLLESRMALITYLSLTKHCRSGTVVDFESGS